MASNDYRIDDLREGMEATSEVVLDDHLVKQFIGLTGDRAPAHIDSEAATRMGFADRIVHGFLVASQFSTLLGTCLPGPRTVIQSIELDFRRPVLVGQRVFYHVKVRRLVPAVATAILELCAEVNREPVVQGLAKCVFRDV